MNLGDKIKRIREEKGLLQKQLASEVGIPYTSYNKIEKGTRDVTVEELHKLARFFQMAIDDIVNFDGDMPEVVTVEDKPKSEQLDLINQLDEEDKSTVFKIIDTMLTKKKFQDFFQKNLPAAQ